MPSHCPREASSRVKEMGALPDFALVSAYASLPWRRPRIDFPGAFYHVINRSNQRATIFHDSADYTAYAAHSNPAIEAQIRQAFHSRPSPSLTTHTLVSFKRTPRRSFVTGG